MLNRSHVNIFMDKRVQTPLLARDFKTYGPKALLIFVLWFTISSDYWGRCFVSTATQSWRKISPAIDESVSSLSTLVLKIPSYLIDLLRFDVRSSCGFSQTSIILVDGSGGFLLILRILPAEGSREMLPCMSLWSSKLNREYSFVTIRSPYSLTFITVIAYYINNFSLI